MRAGQMVAGDDTFDSVVGWDAGVRWIAAWRRFGDWVLVDRRTHPDFCQRLAPDSWQVLWYDSIEAGDVRALLTELRSRKETRRILVVYRVDDPAALDAPGFASLRSLCRDYRATLLSVIDHP
jgi:hypothetical protein